MTKQHTIEIKGLPEGWEVMAIRPPIKDVDYILHKGRVELESGFFKGIPQIIVQKTKPRRIVLEETGEVYLGQQWLNIGDISISMLTGKKWRERDDLLNQLVEEDE